MAYIVVEGPSGVGETNLARPLAEKLQVRLVLEPVEENPFLAPFYQVPERHAFSAQAFFLRYERQDLEQGALFFGEDFIFASLSLAGAEWALCQDDRQLGPRLGRHDPSIYLRAKLDLLLRRIAKRGRAFERGMDPDHLRRPSAAYDDDFGHYPALLHVIEAGEVDVVTSAADRDGISAMILARSVA